MNAVSEAPASLAFGRFRVLPHRRELLADGRPIRLGGRAFDVLMALIEARGAVVGKDALLSKVWPDRIVEENNLQAQVSALRAAFGAERELIRTVSGRGYQFAGEIRILAANPDDRAGAGVAAAQRGSTLPPTNLPQPVSELIGRDAELDAIRALLADHRLVTLTGGGGIGKTRLGVEVARQLLPRFPGGAWLVELSPISDPGHVSAAVAAALGLDLAGGEVSAERVVGAMRGRRLLLVLDTCEHLIEVTARMAQALLAANAAARVIATSQEPLRVEGERAYPVMPLAVPAEGAADAAELLTCDAVRLFVARARQAEAHFAVEPHNAQGVSAICRRLDGIPLALELAAARIAALGIEELNARLDDRFRLLTGGRRTALPRHQTLRATLDWSYELLSESERAVLRRIGVFAGDFSLDAAVAVAGDLPAPLVVDHIADLVARSLIVADLGDEPTQYRLLDTTRLYALDKLRNAAELHEAARRHAEYYRALFEPTEAESESQPQAEWLARYGRHLDNVRAGLDWAFSADGDPQIGVALTVAVVPLWVQLSLFGECRERVERALAVLGGDEPATARARMQLSAARAWSLMYGVGRAREAGPAWTATLDLAERLDDRGYRVRALWGLCIDQFKNGEFRTALEFARRFAGLVADSTDEIDLMMAERILATSLHYLGDQKNAGRHIDRALAHLAALAQQPQIVRVRFDHRVSAHYFQARILWLQGFADRAMRVVEQNIEEGRAIGQALTFCSVLGQGACPIAFLAGDLDAAARYGAMLLDHTERHPVRLWHLWAQCFNGLVTARSGHAAGLVALRGGLEQAGEARFLPRFLLFLGELAACLGSAGEIAAGLETVDEAIARCEARDERWYMAELLRIKGELLLLQGSPGAAAATEDHLRQALDWARRQGALSWELRACASLARLLRDQGRAAAATALLQPVYDRFTEGFDTADLKAAKALLDALAEPTPLRARIS
jgi:predicted ATPase/DNA-binding winged helix-turn-helix (wHTH) protein